MEDAGLEGAEKAPTAQDRQDHAAEFTQDLLLGLEGGAFAAAKVIEHRLASRIQQFTTLWFE
jgi:hypothetical protein